MMMHRRQLGLGIAGLAIFLSGLTWLLAASAGRALWHDEAFGILASVFGVSWRQLWWEGAPGQGSPHPLYYVWEKAALELWALAPQRYWNLFFYFRLTPIFFYALTGTAVFFGAYRALAQLLNPAAHALRAFVAAAFAFFFFRVQFAEYYALEARPYSLWLFLSTVHFFLTISLVLRGEVAPRHKAVYAFASALLCLVASPGLFQVALSFLAIAFPRRLLRDGWMVLPSVLIAAFYARDVGKSGYDTGDFLYYLQCLKEVAYKSFHARSGWVFFPIFFVGAGKILRCPDRNLRARFGGYVDNLIS